MRKNTGRGFDCTSVQFSNLAEISAVFLKRISINNYSERWKREKNGRTLHTDLMFYMNYIGSRCIRCFTNKTLWSLNFLMQQIFPRRPIFLSEVEQKNIARRWQTQLQDYLINSFFLGKANSLSGFLPSDIQGLYTEQGAVLLDRFSACHCHRVGRVQSFFFSRRNWDYPNPLPAGECPPPRFWGEGHIHCGTLHI